ncbi:TonB-dependent receptor plug domain-containing protein [Aliiroseovarius sp.]|uniref:TonB-dependent receptor plug domain-containing protein n=1 Tax=Aliiroseovarius sp. TaxID=1872442 RepID=UPI003BAC4559
MLARILSTTAFVSAVSTPAIAQDYTDLGTIIVSGDLTLSANRGETTKTERSGSTVEIVTREDLEEAGDIQVADYLATLPGLSVTGNGGIGSTTSLRIRGSSGRYIGVYVDGIDVNDPSAPQIAFDFGGLTTDDITRIEVLKGAQSALYGSEAIAGVINITTNRATEPGLHHNLAAEYGSHNTARLSYNMSYLGDYGSFAATLSHIRTDGISAADENAGNTEDDGHEATRLSFSGEYAVSDTVTIGGSGFWQTSETEYDEYSGGPVDGVSPDELSESDQFGLRGFVRVEGGAVEHEFSLQYYQNDRLSSGTNAWGPFAYDYLGERIGLAYQGQAELTNATLTFGLDATRESYESGVQNGEHDMLGAWVQADWHLSEQVELVTVLRHDDHSDFGGKTTGRVSLAWLPTPDITVRAAVGTGFRTPSLFELFSSPYGNAALQPETSVSYELGIEKRFDGGEVSATLFRTEITDLIAWSPTGYTQTPGTGWAQGVELAAAFKLSDSLDMTASYTYTDSENAATGMRLARVPMHTAAVRLNAEVTDRLSTGLAVKHVAGLNDTTGPLADYTVVDATVTYDVSDSAELYLRAENLFDEEYQTVTGYGTPDRSFYFGARMQF